MKNSILPLYICPRNQKKQTMKTNLKKAGILKFKKYQIANLNQTNYIKGGEDDTLTDTTVLKTIPTETK